MPQTPKGRARRSALSRTSGTPRSNASLAPFAMALAVTGAVGTGAVLGCATHQGTATRGEAQASTASVASRSPSAGKSATVSTAPAPFDPVAVGLAPGGETLLCDEHLKLAQGLLDRIKALKGAPPEKLTFTSTLGTFDDAISAINDAQNFPYLLAVTHPDKEVRDRAKLCEPKVSELVTSLYLDADLAAVIKAYAAKGEPLEGENARLLAETLRDFRRNGLDLGADDQTRLRALNAEITEVGQQFDTNLGASTETLEVDAKALDGLPPEYVSKHPVKDGKVTITTDYPEYFPFITFSRDRQAALALYVKFTNRGGDANVKLLERLFALRSTKAKLLGYATWADYAVEPRMAKTAGAVRAFLEKVRVAVDEPAKLEFAALMKEHVALGGKESDRLPPIERQYLEDRVRAKRFQFDAKELANYFEIGTVTQGLLDLTQRMYGLEYRPLPVRAGGPEPDATTSVTDEVWHPDVTAYDVYDATGEKKKIGRFYLDLYPRADKFKHAAMFPIRGGKRLADGTYQEPVAALVCNFPKPAGGGHPALMQHEEVVTFFHEFGHVLHHLLTESALASYSGTNTVRDFVEAPSQMFEEWAYSREVLDLFARHHETGAKIPAPLFDAMTHARAFGRALGTQRQLFLATLDLEYHSRVSSLEKPLDTTQILREVQAKTDKFAFVPGTHFQSSFGHLVGYDAGYYSYQWALSLSRDILTRFKRDGLLSTSAAAAWRHDVLAKGGGLDERSTVATFLGREPNEDAYIAFLKGKD